MTLLTLAVYLPIAATLLLAVYLVSGWVGVALVLGAAVIRLLLPPQR